MRERQRAVSLRKKGLSYAEILKRLPVSISSLSLWLRSIQLSTAQQKRLQSKVLKAHKKAWIVNRERRITKTNLIKTSAQNEIGVLSSREMWLIGIALYWAEGSKQKEHNTGEQVSFSNSDPCMVKLFCKWARSVFGIGDDGFTYALYIHENFQNRENFIRNYWATILDIKSRCIRIYYKKHTVNPYRKNQGDNYRGVLRVRIRRSAEFNRRIDGWTRGICCNL